MRKIKDLLRLKFEAKLSHERIAAATGISKGAVTNYVHRAVQKGRGWRYRRILTKGSWRACCFVRTRPVSSTRCRTMPTCIRSSSAKA